MPRKSFPQSKSEQQEQIEVFAWAKRWSAVNFKIGKLYASANGGKRNLITAVLLKKSGVKSGIPDIHLPVAMGVYHSLYIELKKSDGKIYDLSENQKWWINALREEGHQVSVCFGAKQACETIAQYMSQKYE